MEHWKVVLFDFMGEVWVSRARLVERFGPVVMDWIAELIGEGWIKVKHGSYRVTPKLPNEKQESSYG